jgi:hypothetical protein
MQIAGLYAAFSPADDAQEADAIAAVIVSMVIAGSVFPLIASVFSKLLELWGGGGYSLVNSELATSKLLDFDEIFGSDSDEGDEIVPYRHSDADQSKQQQGGIGSTTSNPTFSVTQQTSDA